MPFVFNIWGCAAFVFSLFIGVAIAGNMAGGANQSVVAKYFPYTFGCSIFALDVFSRWWLFRRSHSPIDYDNSPALVDEAAFKQRAREITAAAFHYEHGGQVMFLPNWLFGFGTIVITLLYRAGFTPWLDDLYRLITTGSAK